MKNFHTGYLISEHLNKPLYTNHPESDIEISKFFKSQYIINNPDSDLNLDLYPFQIEELAIIHFYPL